MVNSIRNCVYRFLDKDGNVLYVGSTQNALNVRLNNHTHLPKKCYENTATIEYITLQTTTDRKIAELYFINKYKPKYNKQDKDYEGVSFKIIDLEIMMWHKYEGFKSFSILREEYAKQDYIKWSYDHYIRENGGRL